MESFGADRIFRDTDRPNVTTSRLSRFWTFIGDKYRLSGSTIFCIILIIVCDKTKKWLLKAEGKPKSYISNLTDTAW